jgi:hypothetical protein
LPAYAQAGAGEASSWGQVEESMREVIA